MDKIDVINGAYSQLRISGLTVNPSPEELELSLRRYEAMMAELEGRNICLGYIFEEQPNPNSPTGVELEDKQMMDTNLAMRLVPDFNIQPSPILIQQAIQSLSGSSGRSSMRSVQQVPYPRRMARGSGNTLRFNRWSRFQRPERQAPDSCATNDIRIDNTNDYVEPFEAYLGSETICSFVIKADPGLTIVSSDSKPNDIAVNYRVTATSNTVPDGIFQRVAITITTDSGRVETRFIDFNIEDGVA